MQKLKHIYDFIHTGSATQYHEDDSQAHNYLEA